MRSAGQLQNWQRHHRGALDPDAVTEDVFASYLDTAGHAGSGSFDPYQR